MSGFEQRMAKVGSELRRTVKGRGPDVPKTVRDAAVRVYEHLLVHNDPWRKDRAERVQMALRLTSWLASRESQPHVARSFSEVATAYRTDGGFVDWARAQIWDGDAEDTLGQAYAELDQVILHEREADSKSFGKMLSGWLATGSHDESIMPIEDVLDRLVAPFAKETPVLLVVLDGMSMAIFREIQWRLPEGPWLELVPEGRDELQPAIAAVPSVTQVSRTSLLSGALRIGVAKDEVAAFAAHPLLNDVSDPGKPPILFHKGDLTAPGSVGLSKRVVDALADQKQRVVGLVINAIDDHLAKGDQVRLSWSINAIRPLNDVLSAAQDGGRIVIMVSDHGHVVEHHSELIPGGSEERWRDPGVGSPKPRPPEILLEGPRVLLGHDNRVIAPWSECIRYGPKKNGYHGGASPQEVVVPLGVFSARGVVPPGWREVGRRQPEWWHVEAEQASPLVSVKIPARPAKVGPPAKPPTGQGDLGLSRPKPAEPRRGDTPVAEKSAWIEKLLTSETMKSQRKQAARTPISDERLRAVLGALDERGGKLTRPALASRLRMPALRVGGLISALQRILNVDGYPVLAVDEASDTIALNLEMLKTQFDLGMEP
jgi:hypothetical protein